MDTPLHDENRLSLQLADHKPSCMSINCRDGPVGQVTVRNNIGCLNGISKIVQAGTENDPDAWPMRAAPADRIRRLINLFERNKYGHNGYLLQTKNELHSPSIISLVQ